MSNSLITETVDYKGYTIAKLEFPCSGGISSSDTDETVIGMITWQIYLNQKHVQNALSMVHAKEIIDGFKV